MTAQYIKEGWRPHGPGLCRCPDCGTLVTTNALGRAQHKCPTKGDAYDADGKPLRVGDTVCKVEYGANAIRRLVMAIGQGEHIEGWIMVSSSMAWEHPRNYRKVR